MLESLPQNFMAGFVIGGIIGILIGSLIAETLSYLYWKREIYPLLDYIEAQKLEQKLRNGKGLE
jgi:hypothetical protein